MRIRPVFRGALLCFCVSLVLAANLCCGEDQKTVVVEVVGRGECADCAQSKIKTSQAFSGLRVTIDCKSRNGDLERRGAGELDHQGKFRVNLPSDIVEDGKLKEECYAQLHSASSTPCPAYSGIIESTKLVSKSKNNEKHTFELPGNLKFSPATCTSAFLWPYFKYPPLSKLPPIFPKWKLPPLKNFGHHPYLFPPLPPKIFPPKTLPPPVPIPPPIPITKPCPPIKKPLPPPVPIYKPNPPPTPIKKPCPPTKKPLPPPVPIYKPNPPPTPIKKPCPPTKKPLPPPVSISKPPPVPVYKPKPKPPVYEPKPKPPVYKPNPPVYMPPPVPIYKPKPKPPPVYFPPKVLPPPITPIYKPKPPIFYKPLPPLPKIPPFYKKPCPPLPKLPPSPKIPPKYFHHDPKFGKWPPLPPSSPIH